MHLSLESQWQNCLSKLRAGEFDGNWPRHEFIRTGNPDHAASFVPTPTFDKPVWEGQTEAITLLVNADFGMGDTIHFWRFIEAAKNRVKKIYLRCDEDFKTIMTVFSDVVIIGKDEPLPEFDKVIHMMALPGVLGIKRGDINGQAYLFPNFGVQPHSALVLMSLPKFYKVGLCTQGNPFNPRDSQRSIPFSRCAPLILEEGMRFFMLNKVGEQPEGHWDMRGYMTDWNATAYLLYYLNMIITVDTAVAHLGGAIGALTWMILGPDTDWRWGTEGEKTLWYDSVRVFRYLGSWEATIQNVADTLREHVKSF